MAYQHKDNSGSIFRNDKKEKDTHADYRGDGLIGGVSYWFDAWVNKTQDGSKQYLSLKFKAKEARPGDTPDAPAMGGSPSSVDVPAQGGADAVQDDLPF